MPCNVRLCTDILLPYNDVEHFSETAAERVLARDGPDVEEYADGARPPQSFHLRIESDVVKRELWKLFDRWVRCRRRRRITKKEALKQRRTKITEPRTPARIPTVAPEGWALLDELLASSVDAIGAIAETDGSGADGLTMK